MQKLLLPAVLGAGLLVSGCCVEPVTDSVAAALNGQETSQWCWAASGQMTMNFIRAAAGVTQADEANQRFGRTDCGNSPTPTACIMGGWPEYSKYDFSSVQTTDAPLSWEDIRKQIACANKPFAFSWHWTDAMDVDTGAGHMMVVVGYSVINGVNFVRVHDPLPVNAGTASFMTYDRYVGGTGQGHTHWNDFYDITSTAP